MSFLRFRFFCERVCSISLDDGWEKGKADGGPQTHFLPKIHVRQADSALPRLTSSSPSPVIPLSQLSATMAAPPQPMQPMQEQMLPRPDPVMQAVIEADFRPVDLTLDSTNVAALCASHSREKCDDCDVDYVQLNRLSKVLTANPKLPFPPPPNVVNQKLSQIVNQTKEEGNVRHACIPIPTSD